MDLSEELHTGLLTGFRVGRVSRAWPEVPSGKRWNGHPLDGIEIVPGRQGRQSGPPGGWSIHSIACRRRPGHFLIIATLRSGAGARHARRWPGSCCRRTISRAALVRMRRIHDVVPRTVEPEAGAPPLTAFNQTLGAAPDTACGPGTLPGYPLSPASRSLTARRTAAPSIRVPQMRLTRASPCVRIRAAVLTARYPQASRMIPSTSR